MQHHHHSLNVELSKVNESIFIVALCIPTNTELQVISSWLRKLLAEPWEVWRITACTFKTIATLPIPQWVIRVENETPWTSVNCRLTVVVRAYKSRRWCSIASAWTTGWVNSVSIMCSCICPDMLPRTGSVSYANSINISTINVISGRRSVIKCICWCKLVTPHSSTHLSILNSISSECDWITAVISSPSTHSYRICEWQS